MLTRNGGCFDGATSLLDIHDNGTWFSQFSPLSKAARNVLPKPCYTLGMCV